MNDSPDLEFWKILTPIWDDKELFDGNPDVYLRRFNELTHPQKVLFPTLLVVADIKNGGLHQCFWNTTGMFAPEAVCGFEDLGLHDTKTVVQSAADLFGMPFPRNRQTRIEFLDSFTGDDPEDWNPFHKMDDEFFDSLSPAGGYSIEKEDRFDAAINAYARLVSN